VVRAEQVTDPIAYHAEGPVWSTAWGGLRWVDMLAGDVLALGPDQAVTRRHVGSVVAALRPRKGGGAILALERGFAVEALDGTVQPYDEVWTDPTVRMNEGGCDPDGRFYCGSMAYDQREGAASVYRLDPDGQVHTAIRDVTVSNGLDWSPDGTRAFYNDTGTHRIDVFDYVDGELVARRPFVDLTSQDARPDGLVADSESGVWTALNGDGVVHRYDSAGRLSEVIELPVKQITACTLGGPNLDQLYITTSREGLEPDEEPLAGSLFCADVGVRGLPVREFVG